MIFGCALAAAAVAPVDADADKADMSAGAVMRNKTAMMVGRGASGGKWEVGITGEKRRVRRELGGRDRRHLTYFNI